MVTLEEREGEVVKLGYGIKVQTIMYKIQKWGFRGGSVVKNPPANAGNRGSIPGPERSHMPPVT